jgi:hypothetical protein
MLNRGQIKGFFCLQLIYLIDVIVNWMPCYFFPQQIIMPENTACPLVSMSTGFTSTKSKYTAHTYGVFNPKRIKVYEWAAGCGLSVRIDVTQSRGVAAAMWDMGTPSLLWHLKGSSVLIQPITADVQILADMVLAYLWPDQFLYCWAEPFTLILSSQNSYRAGLSYGKRNCNKNALQTQRCARVSA